MHTVTKRHAETHTLSIDYLNRWMLRRVAMKDQDLKGMSLSLDIPVHFHINNSAFRSMNSSTFLATRTIGEEGKEGVIASVGLQISKLKHVFPGS